jgi:8-oxo-dGTP pyrophosphatase MutT (NUDIX family)
VRELAVATRCDEERHIFHLRATIAMPDEWQVMTPDGGGLVWLCSWVSFEGARAAIDEHQREWLDVARPGLDASAAHDPAVRPRPPLPRGLAERECWEEFWAYPFFNCRFVASYVDEVDPDTCVRTRGVCVDGDGHVLLVLDNSNLWGIPGGGREGDESAEEALAREIWEEARARVTGSRYLTAMRVARLDERGGVASIEHHAHYWARIEVDPWEGGFETTERRLLPVEEALDLSAFPEHTRPLFERAARVDPLLVWERELPSGAHGPRPRR